MTGADHQSMPSGQASPSTTDDVTFDGRVVTPAERERAEAGPAVFSPCAQYRYTLTRVWDETLPSLMVIGLNPSTADHTKLDPTLRRVRFFAKRGLNPRPDGDDIDADPAFGGFIMTNLFAFRATQPKNMMAADDPVGPENDRWLRTIGIQCVTVLAGWGTKGGFKGRDLAVMKLLDEFDRKYGDMTVYCLERTKDGHPKHPLYVKGDRPMTPYVRR